MKSYLSPLATCLVCLSFALLVPDVYAQFSGGGVGVKWEVAVLVMALVNSPRAATLATNLVAPIVQQAYKHP